MLKPKIGLWIVAIDDLKANSPELQPALRRCGLSTLDIVSLCIEALDSDLGRSDSGYLEALALGLTNLIETVNEPPSTLDQITLSMCCWTTVEYLKRRLPSDAMALELDTTRSIKTLHMLVTSKEVAS